MPLARALPAACLAPALRVLTRLQKTHRKEPWFEIAELCSQEPARHGAVDAKISG